MVQTYHRMVLHYCHCNSACTSSRRRQLPMALRALARLQGDTKPGHQGSQRDLLERQRAHGTLLQREPQSREIRRDKPHSHSHTHSHRGRTILPTPWRGHPRPLRRTERYHTRQRPRCQHHHTTAGQKPLPRAHTVQHRTHRTHTRPEDPRAESQGMDRGHKA